MTEFVRKLETRWGKGLDEEKVLSEYPRPLMIRESYVNLNGWWEYAIRKKRREPGEYDGRILVPFSPECQLSGVERQLLPGEFLWYRRDLPGEVKPEAGYRWLLHFGAVDQKAVVFVNKKKLAAHLGGYLPFTVDVTEALKSQNELHVMVQDLSDTSYHAKGKQKLKASGMFYTAQSGIWQTVWMEKVPRRYVKQVKLTPRLDDGMVDVLVEGSDSGKQRVSVEVTLENGAKLSVEGEWNRPISLRIPSPHVWCPEDPYLYLVKIKCGEDVVDSYFAMRKVHRGKDARGVSRIFLNNEPYFCNGVLDQGYWPESLYTPPSDEAMIFDIEQMKDLGFNMLRKHIKIEPQRWYYHCDRLGMLVWQDMVNGGEAYHHWFITYLATAMEQLNLRIRDDHYWLLSRREKEGQREFAREMKETVEALYSHPSILTWVIFNEGWGQFHAQDMTEQLEVMDDTRLIDQASGWFDQKGGDYRSIHNYFFGMPMKLEERIIALTEYAGYSCQIPEHTQFPKVYGYKTFETVEEWNEGVRLLMEEKILPKIRKGLSALVFTQLSDVEEEVNGIYTYDREILKGDAVLFWEFNQKLAEEFALSTHKE